MIALSKAPTIPPEDAPDKKTAKIKLKKLHRRLFELQNKFYADGRYALLVILQGMDTSGKDGIIRHVIRSMNPMGINIKAFGVPTESEQKHDFLWRIYSHLPAQGIVGVFNRSYYEDILVPTVKGTHSQELLEHRLDMINKLETHLQVSKTFVLKFFLHISKEEQEKRVSARKKKKHKKWKYNKSDESSQEAWDTTQKVYESLINRCEEAPWHVVPSDKKWYRNYYVAKVLKNFLKKLDLKYPGLDED
ncbi:UDP-galactose-lipid carrier transferase [Fulvivirga imtechensis AK7]|uniref:UDP-galactose-lipid carrier transferase n=1 Tax=Fulvivirga imtechensis AK7 TaxID=1237149 RepID=L8JXU6_9BACT|nr:PPK2 family polyphosphate kinase [Fulvivirga imtechensis]ELR73600.1 UDP-galactose-lipid carrier transferase [Fulvivirga imtechensis AK7]